jgi:CDP-diacylglycerol pyrophosphatase
MRALLVLILLALGGCQTAGTGRNALWTIVSGSCVPHAAAGNPAPCLAVDSRTGTALLKDEKGRTQVLLIPTTKVTGIEDPQVLTRTGDPYFATAWSAGTLQVDALVGKTVPRQDLSLAINSPFARSQDQLHIHVDCISLAARAQLVQFAGTIGTNWAPLPVPLNGEPYWAIRAPSLDAPHDPFQLVAEGLLPKIGGSMDRMTIVVVGSQPGFIVLAGQADRARGDFGNGEALQDHDCALASEL